MKPLNEHDSHAGQHPVRYEQFPTQRPERQMNRRSVLRAIGGGSLVIGTGLAGCTARSASNEESSPVEGTLVEMTSDKMFEPAKITVAAGETVVWRNVEKGLFASTHTVTAYEDRIPDEAEYFASGGFTSEQASRDGYEKDKGGGLDSGAEYEHVFDVPGRYEYFCIPHESSMMKGSIIVE